MIVSPRRFPVRQFFLSVPREIAELPRSDGASSSSFSAPSGAMTAPHRAMFVIQFIYAGTVPLAAADNDQAGVLHPSHRHKPELRRRCPHRMADRHGHGIAGAHPPGHRRRGDAEAVYRGHDGHGKIRKAATGNTGFDLIGKAGLFAQPSTTLKLFSCRFQVASLSCPVYHRICAAQAGISTPK